MKKVNVEQQAKRKKRQRSKHAKYMASETRKICDVRANGQCEMIRTATHYAFGGWTAVNVMLRCQNSEGLQHHHRTYARYGGNERPSDILVVCKDCHAYLESQHPTRKANRVRSGFSSEDSAE